MQETLPELPLLDVKKKCIWMYYVFLEVNTACLMYYSFLHLEI